MPIPFWQNQQNTNKTNRTRKLKHIIAFEINSKNVTTENITLQG